MFYNTVALVVIRLESWDSVELFFFVSFGGRVCGTELL